MEKDRIFLNRIKALQLNIECCIFFVFALYGTWCYDIGFSQTLVDQYNYKDPETFVGNSMWLFSSDGVFIYSPDGSEGRKHIPPEQVCEDKATFTGPSYKYCRFNDIVSDGKRYVWAGT